MGYFKVKNLCDKSLKKSEMTVFLHFPCPSSWYNSVFSLGAIFTEKFACFEQINFSNELCPRKIKQKVCRIFLLTPCNIQSFNHHHQGVFGSLQSQVHLENPDPIKFVSWTSTLPKNGNNSHDPPRCFEKIIDPNRGHQKIGWLLLKMGIFGLLQTKFGTDFLNFYMVLLKVIKKALPPLKILEIVCTPLKILKIALIPDDY